MQYLEFGKTGIKVSRLGLGCMRLPSYEKDGKTVFDEEKGIALIRKAYELGINYFDTAPGYCDTVSEIIVGKALKGFREKVYLSTKNPIENASGDDYDKRLEMSLKKTDAGYIDFYHFWGISLDTFINKICVPDGPLDRVKKWKAQGVVRHISFSFHDKPENLAEIIRRGDGVFESLLCQYNLLDRSNEEGMAFAHKEGLGVVVMGPVGGGRLGTPSQVIQNLLPGKVQSSAEVALRFVFTNPNIHIALSGMGSVAMLEENAALADNTSPLNQEEKSRLEATMKENERLAGLYCTGCKYCMPCPQGINIPEVFTLMNYHRVYKITEYAKQNYAQIGKVPWRQYKNAAACVECGICEDKCPQKLPIRAQLKETHKTLAG
ncbi:MAG: aldo/keto reductase [Treponema sp.]|jgi:predicted aldo/keto reductase-like oxidoreductase|nr:aldo/keto reductase [Treponema sp.]